MNEILRAKIIRKLDGLSDETGRQILDYLEFVESKYNRSRRSVSPLKRVAETIEETLGGANITDAAAKGTAQMVEAAGRMMSGLAAAGRAVADELSKAAPPPPPPPEDALPEAAEGTEPTEGEAGGDAEAPKSA